MFVRNTFAIVTASLIAMTGMAADFTASGDITAVTVFPDRALVTRQVEVTLPAGDHRLLLTDLPQGVIGDSLRVSGNANQPVAIGSIEHQRRYQAALTSDKEQLLQEELQALQDNQALYVAEKQALDFQLQYIERLAEQSSSTQVNSTQASNTQNNSNVVRMQDWNAAWETLGEGQLALLRQQHMLSIQQRELQAEITAKQQALNAVSSGRKAVTEVTINLRADGRATAVIDVQYQIAGASWQPQYEARLNLANTELELVEKAQVRQNTGEDWTDVTLTLSTARPSQNTALPTLQPWYLYSQVNNSSLGYAGLMDGDIAPAAPVLSESTVASGRLESSELVPAYRPATAMQALTLNSEFAVEHQLQTRSTIPSDNVQRQQPIAVQTLPVALTARIVPQMALSAWLYSEGEYQGAYPLLPGKVALFRDNTFVGNGSLPLLRPKETLTLGFGEDTRVKVALATLEDEQTESGVFSTDITRRKLWRSKVTNYHQQAIAVEVWQKLPVSTDDDVEVKRLGDQPDEENKDDQQGIMVWQKDLLPNQLFSLDVGYQVTYPENQPLVGL